MFWLDLTYSQMKVLSWVVLIIGTLLWIVFASRFNKSFSDFFNPKKIELPDEITIEIVKENSQSQTSASQTEPSALPESAAEHLASGDVSRPMQKAGDVPE